jgi:hypothetical protein
VEDFLKDEPDKLQIIRDQLALRIKRIEDRRTSTRVLVKRLAKLGFPASFLMESMLEDPANT